MAYSGEVDIIVAEGHSFRYSWFVVCTFSSYRSSAMYGSNSISLNDFP